jgi:hypothetical protein
MYGFFGMGTTVLFALIASVILNEDKKGLDGLTWKTRKE